LDGRTAGLAYVGTMCLQSYSVSVVEDGGAPLSNVISVASHEIGHNFNMEHDDGW